MNRAQQIIDNHNNIEEVVIKHVEKGNIIISSFGNYKFENPSDAESIEDAENVFSADSVKNVNDFVGLALHVMQQVGGKLILKGKEVKAKDINQTSGDPIKNNDELLVGGKLVKFKDIK